MKEPKIISGVKPITEFELLLKRYCNQAADKINSEQLSDNEIAYQEGIYSACKFIWDAYLELLRIEIKAFAEKPGCICDMIEERNLIQPAESRMVNLMEMAAEVFKG